MQVGCVGAYGFVCVDVLCPIQHFFGPAGMIACLPGLN